MIGTVAGAGVAAVVFGCFIGLGFLLSSRLAVSILVPVIILGVAGAYAGWLVGLIVFSAVRGPQAEEPDRLG